jgi:hypothetical protein
VRSDISAYLFIRTVTVIISRSTLRARGSGEIGRSQSKKAGKNALVQDAEGCELVSNASFEALLSTTYMAKAQWSTALMLITIQTTFRRITYHTRRKSS